MAHGPPGGPVPLMSHGPPRSDGPGSFSQHSNLGGPPSLPSYSGFPPNGGPSQGPPSGMPVGPPPPHQTEFKPSVSRLSPSEEYDPTNPTETDDYGNEVGPPDSKSMIAHIKRERDDHFDVGRIKQEYPYERNDGDFHPTVSPPDDPQLREAIENLAHFVAQNGPQAEQAAREKNRENALYWWLYDEISRPFKYFRARVDDLRRQRVKMEAEDQAAFDGDSEELGSDGRRDQRRKKRRSRWGPQGDPDAPTPPAVPPPGIVAVPQLGAAVQPLAPGAPGGPGPQQQTLGPYGIKMNITPMEQMNATYAKRVTGGEDLSDVQKRQIQEQQQMNAIYDFLTAKKKAMEAQAKLLEAGMEIKPKYDYDSDEETDGGTWEHRKRQLEMQATKEWAVKLTEMGRGKHHIGDFLPPEELEKFMETFSALKEGREPDLSDYKEFKLTCENVGFQMLKKMGWKEGEGLGTESQGIKAPVNKGQTSIDGRGLGTERPSNLSKEDDEYDAYRKRMMLAYRFRPNPLNNPRRPYY